MRCVCNPFLANMVVHLQILFWMSSPVILLSLVALLLSHQQHNRILTQDCAWRDLHAGTLVAKLQVSYVC